MSKKKTANKIPVTARQTQPGRAAKAKTAAEPSRYSWLSARAIRETIDAFAVAFILAFLFRSFDAEAFVIPTGSMATTLLGEHKDLACPNCGYRYQAGASSESEDLARQRGHTGPVADVVWTTCPLCRYMANVDPHTPEGAKHPTYGGDRILVTKFTYEFSEPRRWDVVVFKYPGEAQTNYIKRLVGLPHEQILIREGDLHIKSPGDGSFALARRAPDKIRAMAPIVYDNDYVVDAMTKAGWPLRWQAWPATASDQPGWKSNDGGRSFEIERDAKDPAWIVYRHIVPSVYDWERISDGRLQGDQPKPQLITDFVAYDDSLQRGYPRTEPMAIGMHWVGDLLLQCELDLQSAEGTVLLELIKAGQHYRCTIDCATGEATLAIDGRDDFHPTAQTAVKGRGIHQVALANVDRQLVVWVDGYPLEFDTTTTYETSGPQHPQATAEDPLDLAPARIGARGSGFKVNHLRLYRDIYYIATEMHSPVNDYPRSSRLSQMNYQELLQFWSTPAMWNPPDGRSPLDDRRESLFTLAADQFFVLGDNSPMSQDARLWEGEQFVSRELLIGKAFFIFWPHSFHRLPGTPIPFPFFPNLARMRLIR